jgi:hypothetical protein
VTGIDRPIDRPTVKWTKGDRRNPPGWLVVINYESGSWPCTWPRGQWREAVDFALAQCGPRERSDIRPRAMVKV